MNIILHELNWSQTSETLSIANKLDIALYDATYLFLSEKINAQLVTSDTKLCEKAKDHFKVLHLKDYV